MIFDRLMDELIKTLPQGSGFDTDWEYRHTESGFLLKSEYHVLNPNGFYEGYQPFTVEFFADGCPFMLTFQRPIHSGPAVYGLREYIEDTLAEWEWEFAQCAKITL